jgi:hypothetical protein
MTQAIRYEKQDILAVLRHINGLVVSLDRLGSAQGDMPIEQWREAVVEYLLKSNAARNLSTCRTILSEPFSRELGADEMDELERELQGVDYWSCTDFMKKLGRPAQ